MTQDAATPDHLPRPDFHFTGQVGRTYQDSDPAQFPQPVAAPKGAPNIVLILLDDVGFGQFSTFGGGVGGDQPTLSRATNLVCSARSTLGVTSHETSSPRLASSRAVLELTCRKVSRQMMWIIGMSGSSRPRMPW